MATFKSKLVTIASTSVYESLLNQTEMKLRNSDKLSQFEADVPLRNIHVYILERYAVRFTRAQATPFDCVRIECVSRTKCTMANVIYSFSKNIRF